MELTVKHKLLKIPVLKGLVKFLDKIRIFEELTLYELLELYIFGLGRGALGNRAGAIAFSFFMALFPFALFILNLIPYIPVAHFQQDFLKFVEESVPPNTYDAISAIIMDILNNSYDGLLSTGFLLSIFLQANGLNAILTGFENSHRVKQKRSFLPQYMVALGMSFVITFLLITTVTIIVVLEIFLQKTKIQDVLSDNIPLLIMGRYVFLMLMILVITSVLFKFGTIQTGKRAFISAGSVFTTILVILSSYGFGIWVVRFSKYNELYGSIGTLLVIMIYIWLNCVVLLLGFELNITIDEHKQKMLRKKSKPIPEKT